MVNPLKNNIKVKLDFRLTAIAALVREGKSVVDIGSDHALIPCYLWQNGFTNIIASDINSAPLACARKTITRYGIPSDSIKLVLSDGFENIPACDDIIVAGMGGENILQILRGCKYKDQNTRFILQPMTRHEELRRGLYSDGYEIICEKFAACKKKNYTVIYAMFTGKKTQISDVFAFIGKQDNPVYVRCQLTKIKKLAKGDERYYALAAEIERLLL